MTEEETRRLLRDKGMCGHVSGEAIDRRACILTKGHDGGVHDGAWSVEAPMKIEAIPVREVWRLRHRNLTQTALSMIFASSKEGAELLAARLNLLGEDHDLLASRMPHPAQVMHSLHDAAIATEKQIEIAMKRGDHKGVEAWRESLQTINLATVAHSEARSKQKW